MNEEKKFGSRKWERRKRSNYFLDHIFFLFAINQNLVCCSFIFCPIFIFPSYFFADEQIIFHFISRSFPRFFFYDQKIRCVVCSFYFSLQSLPRSCTIFASCGNISCIVKCESQERLGENCGCVSMSEKKNGFRRKSSHYRIFSSPCIL